MKTHYLIILLTFPILIYGQETIKKTRRLFPSYLMETYFTLKSDESIRHGSYQKFNSQGVVLVNGYYKNGQKDSIWNEYDMTGKFIKSGSYKADKMVGLWNFYDYEGALEQSYDFSTNKLLYYKLSSKDIDKQYVIITPEGFKKVKLDRPPLYIGGSGAIFNQIASKLKYPILAAELRVMGTVEIGFLIDSNGKTSNYRIIEGIGSGCDEEALRVVELITENWLPGIFEGKAVTVEYVMPIHFKVR